MQRARKLQEVGSEKNLSISGKLNFSTTRLSVMALRQPYTYRLTGSVSVVLRRTGWCGKRNLSRIHRRSLKQLTRALMNLILISRRGLAPCAHSASAHVLLRDIINFL